MHSCTSTLLQDNFIHHKYMQGQFGQVKAVLLPLYCMVLAL